MTRVGRVLLLDIEGTTTPIDFVVRTLFPFARERMAAFVRSSLDADDRAQLVEERRAETDAACPPFGSGAGDDPTAYLLWLMSIDRKSRGLKSIQGKIWQAGYLDGSLRGEVYDDVPDAMRRWNERGGRCAIYSSGSVLAQRLLFRHSTAGDLTGLISDHFDTEVGGKREVHSYTTIADRLGVAPSACVFVSDIAAECDAAQQAGMVVRLAMRPGAPAYAGKLATVRTLDEVVDQLGAPSRS